MAKKTPALTVGMEEELFLVDKASGIIVPELPNGLLDECQAVHSKQIITEFLKSQVELVSKPCDTIAELREDIAGLRNTLIDVADKHKVAPIAASTHPFSSWREQKPNTSERYARLANALQIAARRMMINGMHIHIGIEDEALRLHLLKQVAWYLPYLLALSTSSPYWAGIDTGLNCFRLCVIHDLPRAGMPEYFDTYEEYNAYTKAMTTAGVIEDPSEIWWDIRPSFKFPTLEMRVTDICPRLENAIAIAALYQCLLHMCYHRPQESKRFETVQHYLIRENRWRAQRYSMEEGSFLGIAEDRLIPFADAFDDLLNLVSEDANKLGVVAELEKIRKIVQHGTSADRQRRIFKQEIANGKSEADAYRAVVDLLVTETRSHRQEKCAKAAAAS